jgi:hypothetical protein
MSQKGASVKLKVAFSQKAFKLLHLGEGAEPVRRIDSRQLVDFRTARKSRNDMISKSAVQTLYKKFSDCNKCQTSVCPTLAAFKTEKKCASIAHLQIIFASAEGR